MALINSFKVVEPYIPTPNEQFYMGPFSRLPEEIVNQSHIYAIIVDEINKKVVKAYRAAFIVLSNEKSNYLFINRLGKDISASTRYIASKKPVEREFKKDDWEFNVDNIGLYAVSGSRHKEKIYFATDASDINEVTKIIEEKETLITETVYV